VVVVILGFQEHPRTVGSFEQGKREIIYPALPALSCLRLNMGIMFALKVGITLRVVPDARPGIVGQPRTIRHDWHRGSICKGPFSNTSYSVIGAPIS
jgi:hypothetical protein